MAKLALASNVRRLATLGLVHARRLTDGQIRRLNKLTSAEVRALISIKRKVGRGGKDNGFGIF